MGGLDSLIPITLPLDPTMSAARTIPVTVGRRVRITLSVWSEEQIDQKIGTPLSPSLRL